jgi:hypothetical protein
VVTEGHAFVVRRLSSTWQSCLLELLQQRMFAGVVTTQSLRALVKRGSRPVSFRQLTKVLQNRNSFIVISRPRRDSKCLPRCSACSCFPLVRSRSAASRFLVCRSFVIASARARICAVARRGVELSPRTCALSRRRRVGAVPLQDAKYRLR